MLPLHLGPNEVDIVEGCLFLRPCVMCFVLLGPVAQQSLPENGLDDVMIVSAPYKELHRLLLLHLWLEVPIASINCLAEGEHELMLRGCKEVSLANRRSQERGLLWWHRDVKLTEFRLEVVYIGVVVLGVFVLIDG